MKLGMLKYHLENIVNFLTQTLEPYKDVISSKNDWKNKIKIKKIIKNIYLNFFN